VTGLQMQWQICLDAENNCGRRRLFQRCGKNWQTRRWTGFCGHSGSGVPLSCPPNSYRV